MILVLLCPIQIARWLRWCVIASFSPVFAMFPSFVASHLTLSLFPFPFPQERILTRLAMTDDNALEDVLKRLFPLLLPQLASPHTPVQRQAMTVLRYLGPICRSTIPLATRASTTLLMISAL